MSRVFVPWPPFAPMRPFTSTTRAWSSLVIGSLQIDRAFEVIGLGKDRQAMMRLAISPSPRSQWRTGGPGSPAGSSAG